MSKRILVRIGLLLLAGVALAAGFLAFSANSGLQAGQELSSHQLWPQAREQLARYLWLHPGDGRARMLMAEALIKDSGLPPQLAVDAALQHLERIRDSSPLAADARLQEARLTFLILQRPARAEKLLQRVLALGGEGLPVRQLQWTLLNATGRYDLSEPVFWKIYELSPPEERPLRLREWYMSQFFPNTFMEGLDRTMGVLGPQESGSRTTESRRYLRFRELEPESPLHHAALAQWCQEEGDPTFGAQILAAAAGEIPATVTDPYFLAAQIAVAIDLGKFDEAESYSQRWPEDDRGFLYWKWHAIVLDDVLHEHQQAISAYDRAIHEWPGPIDWRLRYRKIGCLTRTQQSSAADEERVRAEKVKAIMTADVHEGLRSALGDLTNRENISKVIAFYRQLDREREARAWEEFSAKLPESNATAPQPQRPGSQDGSTRVTSPAPPSESRQDDQ